MKRHEQTAPLPTLSPHTSAFSPQPSAFSLQPSAFSLRLALILLPSTLFHLPSYIKETSSIMSEISDTIQDKCLAFGDRIIKLNDYLLEQASLPKSEGRGKHQPSALSHHTSRVPVYLKSVAALANQLLRSGTSIGANNAEACNAISKADFKSKSFIALKEARESLYWIELLHRNNYLTDEQYNSINADCEELVKILVHRCKKLNSGKDDEPDGNI